MPTVFYFAGIRFFFFSNENDEPIHVHVEKGEANGKVWIMPEIAVAYFHGFTNAEERAIMNRIIEKRQEIINKWNEHFQQ